MGEYNWLDDDDDDDEDDSPSGRGNSSNALAEARKAARRTSRENRELKERLALLEKRDRERVVTDAIKEHGLNPKIARLVPQDIDPDDLPQFLSELSEVLGVTPAPTGDDGQGSGEGTAPADETLDPNFAAWQRIAQQQAAASTPVNSEQEMFAKIAAAQSPEDLSILLHGNPNGPQVY